MDRHLDLPRLYYNTEISGSEIAMQNLLNKSDENETQIISTFVLHYIPTFSITKNEHGNKSSCKMGKREHVQSEMGKREHVQK